MPIYPYVNIHRRVVETSGSPHFTPAMENVRPLIEYEQGPQDGRETDPIVQSDFNFEGKPDTHTSTRAAIAVATNYESTLAIEEEEFHIVAWARPNWVGTPPGTMQSWTERTNVDIPPAVAYGSLFSLPGVG